MASPRKGASPRTSSPTAGPQMTIIYAAKRGYDSELADLLKKEPKKVNEKDELGNTALRT